MWSRFTSTFTRHSSKASRRMMFGATFACASLTTVAFVKRNDWSNMFSTQYECSDIYEKEEKTFDPRRKPLSAREDPFHRSRRNRPLNDLDLKIFSGSASQELAEEIADHLGTKISGSETGKFADGETYVRVNETVRGKDCYIIQSTCPPANDNLMELFLMISTLKRASAKSITAVIPYYGYARQDRKTEDRVSIAGADVARLLETMGVDSVISVDLHCWQIEGFFENKTPVINLEAGIIGMEYVLDDFGIENIDNLVVVSPDAGGVGRAKRFQGALLRRGFPEVTLAMIIKQRPKPGVVARMDLIGDVEAAQELKEFGAKKVYAFATHGIFTGEAPERIRDSDLEKVIVTNTIPLSQHFIDTVPSEKFEHVSIGTFMAETIRRIYLKESVAGMYGEDNYREN